MHDAKTHLSRLVEEVAASGESIILAKAGKPIAEIIPCRARKKPEFGFAAKQLGTLYSHDPFDRALLAQALSRHLPFVTADEKIIELGLPLVIDART
jgi:prevent-host-death family protein